MALIKLSLDKLNLLSFEKFYFYYARNYFYIN